MAGPTGTVTLLFSDVQGSTRLLLDLGVEVYAQVLDTQLELQRRAWRAHGGTELGAEGDGCFVVFGSASAALLAAVTAQRALIAHPWPGDVVVAVRMGVHTGTPALHGDRYIGIDVHRAARIAAAAHGGQVLLSDPTAQALRDAGETDGLVELSAHRLGRHSFKDLAQPEELFELRAPGLAEGFPPVRSLGSVSLLPEPGGRLFGRRTDLERLGAVLTDGRSRLVTLTGPGGSGKTRLAVEGARAVAGQLRNGVYFVPLEHTTGPEQVWDALAGELDVPVESRQPAALLAHLASRRALLVLDNLEQIQGAADVVTRLLEAAPGIVVLATARMPLRVPGELEHAVPPLRLPEAQEDPLSSPAVQLFLQQARVARPDLTLDKAVVAQVSELCAALDGLPLAIELAAARVASLSMEELLGRVRSVLDLPSRDGARNARQQTVRQTVRWSYELLGEEQQRLFRLLGVFAAGARPRLVSAVARRCGWQVSDSTIAHWVDDLVEASLANLVPDSGDAPRVSLLNTVRAFAAEELRLRGEDDIACAALVDELLLLAQNPHQGTVTSHSTYLDTLERELANIRAAMGWLIDRARWVDQPQDVIDDRLRLGGILAAELGTNAGHYIEVFDWAGQLLERGTSGGPAARADLMVKSSDVARNLGLQSLYVDLVHEAAQLVIDPAEDDLDVFAPAACHVRLGLGVVAVDQGRGEAARREFEHVLVHQGDSMAHTWCLINLGYLLGQLDEHDSALTTTQLGLEMAERIGDVLGVTGAKCNRAALLRQAGRAEAALEAFRDLVPEMLAVRTPEWQAASVEDLACVLVDLGRYDAAGVLFHCAAALRSPYTEGRVPAQESAIADSVARARKELGPRWDALRLRADELSLPAALDAALS